MAVGGGLRVGVPAVEAWGRKPAAAVWRGAGRIRCMSLGAAGAEAAGGLAEDHYRTLRLPPGASRREVKQAFRRLALMYHPDICKERGGDSAVQFRRINIAYQMLMSNMREAEERLEYWRLKYGLSDEDLDKYRYYVHDHDDDDFFDL
ncbi:hypothetical protein ACP70R_044098 [Stipagrostis hirtigluma subsp. patula]